MFSWFSSSWIAVKLCVREDLHVLCIFPAGKPTFLVGQVPFSNEKKGSKPIEMVGFPMLVYGDVQFPLKNLMIIVIMVVRIVMTHLSCSSFLSFVHSFFLSFIHSVSHSMPFHFIPFHFISIPFHPISFIH